MHSRAKSGAISKYGRKTVAGVLDYTFRCKQFPRAPKQVFYRRGEQAMLKEFNYNRAQKLCSSSIGARDPLGRKHQTERLHSGYGGRDAE